MTRYAGETRPILGLAGAVGRLKSTLGSAGVGGIARRRASRFLGTIRRMYAKGLFAWAALVALTGASMGWGQNAAPAELPPPRKFALLIGASAYPNLRDDAQLLGPGNDVTLTASLLKERFGYTDDDVVTLVSANEPGRQPTYEGIAREFAALIANVGAGDRVFVLLAGHGSQIANDDADSAADKEPDGRDEAFLPQDVTPGKLGKHGPENVIRDDQIRGWLDAIRAKGASVFFVADTCHSGTMDRGGPDTSGYSRTRWINPAVLEGMRLSNDWGNGRDINASDRSDATMPIGLAEVARDNDQKLAGLVALYAVDESTKEPEHPMPPDNRRDGPTYGQLTYAMNWVLARSKRELTYRELAQQIVWRYESWGWPEVSFALGSGEELDRQVLGDGMWKGRSAVFLSRDEEYSRLSLNIGALHGATVGSIYTVYPPVGFENDNVPAGCVKVTEVTPTTARVVSVPYGQAPQTPAVELPAPGRCELAFVAAPSLKMSVGVVRRGPAVSDESVAAVEAAVGQIATMPLTLVRLAAEGEEPDAVLIVASDGVYLRKRPENGSDLALGVGEEPSPIDVFGPFVPDAERTSKFAKAIETMAKAENIRRLATSEDEIYIGSAEDQAVTLALKLQRYDAASNEWVELDRSLPISAYDQDRIRVQVFNEGGEPVDVTILYIDSAFGVVSFYPTMREVDEGGVKNRISPRKAPAEVPFDIEATTLGLEDLIVIATVAEPDTTPQNFAFLEQEGLPRGDDGPDSALSTPLGQLLGHAAFGVGERSGAAAPDIAKYVVHRLSWTVQPKDAERP
jgi:hypothetical protein